VYTICRILAAMIGRGLDDSRSSRCQGRAVELAELMSTYKFAEKGWPIEGRKESRGPIRADIELFVAAHRASSFRPSIGHTFSATL